MRVRFEFSLDDVVDVHLRNAARHGSARAAYLKGFARAAGTSAVGALAVTAVVFSEWPLSGKLALAAVAAVLGAVLYWTLYDDEVRKGLAKHFGQHFKEGERQFCEVELTEAGVSVKQFNSETTHGWREVDEVRETPDSIDIFMRVCGFGVVVRKRAFSTPDGQDEFVRILERHSPVGVVRDAPKARAAAAR